MGAPQIIIIVLMVFSDGITLAKHGEPKTGTENFFTSILSTAIWVGLLYWGGFFK